VRISASLSDRPLLIEAVGSKFGLLLYTNTLRAGLLKLDSKMAASATVIRDTVIVCVTSRKWRNSRRLLRVST